MLFNTHILIGLLFFLIIKDWFTGGLEWIFLLLVLLGSILPDIDSPKSIMNRWSGFIGRIVILFVKHRGIFHSLILHIGLFVLVSYLWTIYYATGLFVGYLAHIIGDGITRGGVAIFYPFSLYKIRGPFRVGGFLEGMILVLLGVLIFLKIF